MSPARAIDLKIRDSVLRGDFGVTTGAPHDSTSRVQATQAAAAAKATIQIRNLRLRTFIGFNADEKLKQQDVVININFSYVVNPGVYRDQVEQALDYKSVTKRVITLVENGRFLLLEKLTADVLALCTQHPAVQHAAVTVDKPHALRFADSVSLTLEHFANPVNCGKES